MRKTLAREWLVLVTTLLVSLAVLPPLLVLKSTRIDKPSIWIETETKKDVCQEFWEDFDKSLAFSRSHEGEAARLATRKLGWKYTFDQRQAVEKPYLEKWQRRTAPMYLHRSRIMAWKAFYLSLTGRGLYGRDSARSWLVVLLPYVLVQFARSIWWAVCQVKR